jgi:hypothetical protein
MRGTRCRTSIISEKGVEAKEDRGKRPYRVGRRGLGKSLENRSDSDQGEEYKYRRFNGFYPFEFSTQYGAQIAIAQCIGTYAVL